MKILITGATGYIGNRLATEAANSGWIVHALVRNPGSKMVPSHPNIILFKGDVTDKESVIKAMYGCEYVFHTAAFTSEGDETNPAFEEVNVKGTQIILDVAIGMNIKKLVFTGSSSVFGQSGELPHSESDIKSINPTTTYAESKYSAEILVKKYCEKGLWSVVVCPTRIYGPGNLTSGNPITRLIKQVYNNRVAFIPGTSKVKGNYVFIDDVVKGHFLALEKGMKGEKYFLGGENMTYKKFFHTLRQLSGNKILIIPIPKWFLKSVTRIFQIIFKLVGVKSQISPKLIDRIWENRVFSNEKAISHLGYSVTDLNEGLSKTISYINEKPEAFLSIMMQESGKCLK